MNLLHQIGSLLRKDLLLEWRQRYALNGIVLYVFSTVMVVYMTFRQPESLVWLTLFWIILLFASVNAVAKSFLQEPPGRMLYYYTLVSPQAVIISKIIYNIALLSLLTLIALFAYSLLMGNSVKYPLLFASSIMLGACSFSNCFTLVSAIAAKAGKNATLMPILSFPLIIPILGLLVRISKVAITGITSSNLSKDIAILIAINGIMLALSLLLFPYLWKD